jgi:hypothetical protein
MNWPAARAPPVREPPPVAILAPTPTQRDRDFQYEGGNDMAGKYESLSAELQGLDLDLDINALLSGKQGPTGGDSLAVNEFYAEFGKSAELGDATGMAGSSQFGLAEADLDPQFLGGIFDYFKNKAKKLLQWLAERVQRFPNCIEGVRAATAAVRLFNQGNYVAAIAKALEAIAKFARCAG